VADLAKLLQRPNVWSHTAHLTGNSPANRPECELVKVLGESLTDNKGIVGTGLAEREVSRLLTVVRIPIQSDSAPIRAD